MTVFKPRFVKQISAGFLRIADCLKKIGENSVVLWYEEKEKI